VVATFGGFGRALIRAGGLAKRTIMPLRGMKIENAKLRIPSGRE
jgi:hypothetical protein